MRAIRLASAAALGIAALSLAAPSASADDQKAAAPVRGTITPSTIAAGGQVTLAVPGCAGNATADSGVFDTTTIPTGTAKAVSVFTDAKPAAVYTVTFTCNGVTSTSELTIAGGAPTTSSTTAPTTTPTGPARGGLGGSVSGVDSKEIAAGAAMVAVAAGATVYVVRRRTSSRRH
ncbi:hypothetical protein [Streptomyces sp. H27-C3]|uniref:hypothetical protein n=1 Tax=Streptomyces sp. H27-C3 TaxID=3046305 RepID=UPI0024BA9237|nr:hypothetical protein [Streptomyces sp. H27-C3]MDJ0465320.1 hypothetical protein [Streptomyces sp. H27-C3]